MSELKYEFIMSQIKHIRDIKENEKIKISLVFYEGNQKLSILKICKGRNLLDVYQELMEVIHPNVAQIYDCVYENGNTYVLEEYIDGKTVSEVLAGTGTFSEKETTGIMMELCDGLDVLHSHEPPIIHNDLKASNIMLSGDGQAKLFDFDISRTYKEDSYKNTRLMGTYEYAAPEHYGFGQSDPRTDIYSLGVTMHEMLKGVGLDKDHNTTYKGPLLKIIKKCVEIDRKKRYASASSLKRALKRYRILQSQAFKTVFASIVLALFLGVGGYFLHGYIEYIQKNVQSDDLNVGETENSEVSEEPVPAHKKLTAIYRPQKYIYSMEAWDDGTYLWIEREPYEYDQPLQYYLMTSDGRKQLVELDTFYDSILAHNPYTNKMYMALSNSSENQTIIYYVKQDLEIQKMLTIDQYIKPENNFGFFSDGTISYHGVLYNESDWSVQGEGILCSQSTNSTEKDVYFSYVINDRIYEAWADATELKGFLEQDGTGNVLNTYLMKDIQYAGHKVQTTDMYCDGNMVYFIGNKDGMSYLYGFDGETYTEIACLDTLIGIYSNLCVTDTSIRLRLPCIKRLYEIPLE